MNDYHHHTLSPLCCLNMVDVNSGYKSTEICTSSFHQWAPTFCEWQGQEVARVNFPYVTSHLCSKQVSMVISGFTSNPILESEKRGINLHNWTALNERRDALHT